MLLAKVVQSRIEYLFKRVDNRIDESKANILIKRGVKDSLGQPTVETIETKKQGKIITTLVY